MNASLNRVLPHSVITLYFPAIQITCKLSDDTLKYRAPLLKEPCIEENKMTGRQNDHFTSIITEEQKKRNCKIARQTESSAPPAGVLFSMMRTSG